MNTPGRHPEGEKILALLDGELALADADEVREHCAACAPCRHVLAEFSAVRGILEAHSPSEPLRPVWPAVQGSLRKAEIPIFRPAFAAATTAVALVGILLGVLVGSIGSRTTEHEEEWYLWSVTASSISEDGGSTLPDLYSTTITREGR